MQFNRFPRRYLAVVLCGFIGASLSGCGGGCDDGGGGGGAAALPLRYRVIDLGFAGEMNSSTLRVNNAGNATGAYQRGDRATRAFLYTGTTPPTDIGTLGGINSFGVNMNETTMVVGNANQPDGRLLAFVYANGEMSPLPTTDGFNSRADGINNDPVPLIVGSLLDNSGVHTATTWRGNVRTDLTKLGFNRSGATDVNDADQIVGEVHNGASDFAAVLWQGGAGFPLGIPVGATSSFARGINNFGQVVGFGAAAPGQVAFLWTPTGPNATTGTMFTLPGLGGTSVIAFDLSSEGIAVGTATTSLGARRAVAWTPSSDNAPNGAITDLNTLLIPEDSAWTIEWATSINDGDFISAWARSPSGQAQRAVLLVPA